MSKLTQKQSAFVREYVIDYNGARAAERAGYSKKTAAVQASKLLKQEKVLEAIKEHQKELIDSQCLTEEKVISQLQNILDRSLQATPVMEWDYSTHEYKESGLYQFDAKGALKALELLGKHLGMFEKKDNTDKDIKIEVSDEVKEWSV